MKKTLTIIGLSIIFIISFVALFFLIVIALDLMNLVLKSSIFAWFYNAYGIEWQRNLWGYCIVGFGVAAVSINFVKFLYDKIMRVEK